MLFELQPQYIYIYFIFRKVIRVIKTCISWAQKHKNILYLRRNYLLAWKFSVLDGEKNSVIKILCCKEKLLNT